MKLVARLLLSYLPKAKRDASASHLWHQEFGLFLRSRASINQLRQALHELSYISDNRGNRYQWRFWQARGLPQLLSHLSKTQGLSIVPQGLDIISHCQWGKQQWRAWCCRIPPKAKSQALILDEPLHQALKQQQYRQQAHQLFLQSDLPEADYPRFLEQGRLLISKGYRGQQVQQVLERLAICGPAYEKSAREMINDPFYSPDYMIYCLGEAAVEAKRSRT